MIISPCKDCVAPKRHVGCRTECEAWKEYEKQKKIEYAEREREFLRNEAVFSCKPKRRKSDWQRKGYNDIGRF